MGGAAALPHRCLSPARPGGGEQCCELVRSQLWCVGPTWKRVSPRTRCARQAGRSSCCCVGRIGGAAWGLPVGLALLCSSHCCGVGGEQMFGVMEQQ